MRAFDWNALRTGDKVLAHDPRTADLTLVAGVVVTVDTQKRGRGPNHIGVDVGTGDGPPVILWPARLAVHRDPREPAESCWRCQAIALRTRQLPASDEDDAARVEGPLS